MRWFRQHLRQRGCVLALLALLTGGIHSAAAAPNEVQRGRALAEHYQCAACHRSPGVAGPQGGVGPTLAQFGRRSYIAGRVPHTPDALLRWLMDPPALVPGTAMPRLGLDAADARAIAAWLRSQQ